MVVLVTGAAGFIGSHVVQLLLERGAAVRATVRKLENARFLETLPKHKHAVVELVEMNLLDKTSVIEAVRGCDTVIHCAASLMVGVQDPQRDVIDPSIVGTMHLCQAIEQEAAVHTVIHTSSVAAIRPTNYTNGQSFSSSDWCDDASPDSNPYGFAKAEAERKIREFVKKCEENARTIRLVTIHPSIVFGPVFHKRHTTGSMAFLKHFTGKLPFVLNMHVNFVDVRDVAQAHIAALDCGEDGARHLLHTKGLWMSGIGRELRTLRPGKKWAKMTLPTVFAYAVAVFHPKLNVRQLRSSLGSHVAYDCGDMEEALGLQLRPYQQTLEDSLDSLSELSRKV